MRELEYKYAHHNEHCSKLCTEFKSQIVNVLAKANTETSGQQSCARCQTRFEHSRNLKDPKSAQTGMA